MSSWWTVALILFPAAVAFGVWAGRQLKQVAEEDLDNDI